MRLVRWAVIAAVAVVVCGAAWQYRDHVAAKLGFGVPAAAAEKASSPAAAAQPQGRRGRANPGGPIPVVATVVAPKSMPIIVEAVGTVQAIASIQLKSRIDSQIMKVNVEEGALVKEGDLLFELDARTLEGAARPDRGADPQGPGAGRAGQARFLARRRSAHQGRRHGGDARHQRHQPEGRWRRSSSPTRRCARTS